MDSSQLHELDHLLDLGSFHLIVARSHPWCSAHPKATRPARNNSPHKLDYWQFEITYCEHHRRSCPSLGLFNSEHISFVLYLHKPAILSIIRWSYPQLHHCWHVLTLCIEEMVLYKISGYLLRPFVTISDHCQHSRISSNLHRTFLLRANGMYSYIEHICRMLAY